MNLVEQWTAEPRPIKLTARDFLQLAESGALDAYHRTELIDGVIVTVSPLHSRHGRLLGEFYIALAAAVKRVGGNQRTFLDTSIRVSSHQVPQPDLVVSTYRGPPIILPVSSVTLIAELSDSTATYDRTTKARIYAEGGVPEYWVIDIHAGEIVRFADPGPDGYTRQKPVAIGGLVEALTINGLVIDTAEIVLDD